VTQSFRSVWGARSRVWVLTSGDRWSDMIPSRRCGCSTCSSGRCSGWSCCRVARPPPRTSSSSCCATKSPSCAAPTHDHVWTGRTGPCSLRSWGGCPDRSEPIFWSLRIRSWARIVASCADDGPTRTGPDGHRSTMSSGGYVGAASSPRGPVRTGSVRVESGRRVPSPSRNGAAHDEGPKPRLWPFLPYVGSDPCLLGGERVGDLFA